MLALLIVGILALAGVAWAAISSNGVVASDTARVDFLRSGSNQSKPYTTLKSADSFTLSTTAVSLTGTTQLPTSIDGNLLHAASFDFVGYTTDAAHPSWPGEAIDWADFDAASTDHPLRTTGTIIVGDGQTLTLAPSATNFIGATPEGTDNQQVLRIDGKGTTTIFGGNGNAPTNAIHNTYAGGTFLMDGILRVAHTNALGFGPVMLNDGTLLDIFDADVSIGKEHYGEGSGAIEKQVLWLRRHLKTGDTRSTPASVTVNVDKKFEVGKHIAESVTSTDYTVTNENNSNVPDLVTFIDQIDPAGFRGVKLIKTGVGPMLITGEGLNNQSGATYTGGTDVEEGSIIVTPATTNAYIGMLGFAYASNPVNESWSAKENFDGAKDGQLAPRHNNHLKIAAGAQVMVTRDQFFGNFSGGGEFVTDYWNASGNRRLFPQITFQSDGTGGFAAEPTAEKSHFSGQLDGPMDLIVNTSNDQEMIALSNPNNSIDEGITIVVDGALSVPAIKTLPPGEIYVGVSNMRNFTTRQRPTFHADGSFIVSSDVFVTDLDKKNAVDTPNLSARRGETVSFQNVTVDGNMRVNFDFGTNYPRYMMGIVAFTDAYKFVGTAGNVDVVSIDRGTLHLEKLPETGWANFIVAGGATLSLGAEARDFSEDTTRASGADLWITDDSRIRVKLTAADLGNSSKVAARETKAVATFDYFDNDLSPGQDAKDRRLVVQVDANNLTIPAGTWIKVLEFKNADNWNSMHYLRENSATGDEDYAKIRIANASNETIHGDTFTARLDENVYAIYLYAEKDIDLTNPDPDPDPVETTQQFIDNMPTGEQDKLVDGGNFISGSTGAAAIVLGTMTAPGNVTVYFLDVVDDPTITRAADRGARVITVDPAYNGTQIKAELTQPGAAAAAATATATVTEGKATISFADVKNVPNGDYALVIKDASGNVIPGADFKVTVSNTITGGGGSSGGCDAGFGAFALLALGAAALLRKKD